MNLSAHDLWKNLFAIDDLAVFPLPAQCADVASTSCGLSARQLRNDVVGSFPAGCIASLLVCKHQRGKVMTQRVSSDGIALPPSVDLALGRQSCVLHEVVQQAVGTET